MRYDIQYIIKPKWRGGFLCRESNQFPVLNIRYRIKGSRKWSHLGKMEIDQYTYRRFKNTYYKDFKKSATDLMTLETKSDYERLTLFQEILENEFSGSLDKLVDSVVCEDITMSRADHEEIKDVSHFAISLVTDGWRTLTTQI